MAEVQAAHMQLHPLFHCPTLQSVSTQAEDGQVSFHAVLALQNVPATWPVQGSQLPSDVGLLPTFFCPAGQRVLVARMQFSVYDSGVA